MGKAFREVERDSKILRWGGSGEGGGGEAANILIR